MFTFAAVRVGLDVSPPRRFAPGRIQRFLLIQLKPKHHRLDIYKHSCHMCVCHAELKSYLLAYLPVGKTFWGETSRGELTKGRKVQLPNQVMDVTRGNISKLTGNVTAGFQA